MNACGSHAGTYYFRTSDGYETDLVLDTGRERWAIEIKLSSSPSVGDMDRLQKVADMIGAERRVLISRTSTPAHEGNRFSTNLEGLIDMLSNIE